MISFSSSSLVTSIKNSHPSFLPLLPPPPGHQQSVQLPEGGPPAASGPSGPETGPLPGVRSSCSGPAGLRLRTGGSLARLHLVKLSLSENSSAVKKLLLAAVNEVVFLTVPNWFCGLNAALPICALQSICCCSTLLFTASSDSLININPPANKFSRLNTQNIIFCIIFLISYTL